MLNFAAKSANAVANLQSSGNRGPGCDRIRAEGTRKEPEKPKGQTAPKHGTVIKEFRRFAVHAANLKGELDELEQADLRRYDTVYKMYISKEKMTVAECHSVDRSTVFRDIKLLKHMVLATRI
ncbi:hypothetical protein [Paenibacillus thiaminolyticus]|uniref:hypothetical protein n=1 Tax=Paenibacillus thiaminolyticus TaxID=49283 RepID=UPI002542F0A3|nr:hypothetical protein [Paenibacillus thiaminolyticus]WII38469.1 hypothetical protein O0V01_04875 [Paenibacillus thiaminolyticus]